MLDKVNAFMNDSERWHDWGLVCFYALAFSLLLWPMPWWFVFILSWANQCRTSYVEIWVERHKRWENINRDFWYDLIIRCYAPIIIACGIAWQTWWLIPLGLVLSYRFKWWDEK